MLLIFTGLHGPVPRGQSLAGIGLTEAGEQQDPQNITGPQDRAPPLNLGDLLPKSVPGVSSNKNKGVLIGAGFPPIPASLAERILKWEYIDMAELVPYIWSLPWSTGQPSKPCRQVRDIAVWMQCFACYTAVLSTRFPENTPYLLAYMVTILGATQEFEGSWTTYDTAYRQQMAVSGNRDWSQTNGSLFTKVLHSQIEDHSLLRAVPQHTASNPGLSRKCFRGVGPL